MKAFPHHHVTTYDYDNRHTHGMDLRDYFAGQVIVHGSFSSMTNTYDAQTAKRAYEIADAMMKAREQE